MTSSMLQPRTISIITVILLMDSSNGMNYFQNKIWLKKKDMMKKTVILCDFSIHRNL